MRQIVLTYFYKPSTIFLFTHATSCFKNTLGAYLRVPFPRREYPVLITVSSGYPRLKGT